MLQAVPGIILGPGLVSGILENGFQALEIFQAVFKALLSLSKSSRAWLSFGLGSIGYWAYLL